MSNTRDSQEKLYFILNEAIKRECERSLEAFTKAAWHIIEPSTPLIWNWHLSTICGYLEAFHNNQLPDKRLIINVPPGTLKSILVSVMYPAWTWVKQPELRYLCITNEQGLSIRDALRMKQIISSEWFQDKWPLSLAADQNEKTLYSNEKNGFRQSQGITASNTGKRGDCVVGSTLVSTEIGDIRIDELINMNKKPKVFSLNHNTGCIELKEVVATKQSLTNKTIKVSTMSCDIICTPEHRIFTGARYEKAKDISFSKVSVLLWPNNAQEWKVNKMRSVCRYNTFLRYLRSRLQKIWSGIRQAFKAWNKDRPVLLKTMCKTISQPAAYYKSLRSVWAGFQTSISKVIEEVLFKKVFGVISFTYENLARQSLRVMRRDNDSKQRKTEVLFYAMQKQGSFRTDEWRRELAFPLYHGQGWIVSQDSPIDSREGWEYLCSLFSNKNNKGAISSSYRLECREQRPRESHSSLRLLSHEGAQGIKCAGELATASPIEYSQEPIQVYDIQVEGNHNFFANGILVHNCVIIDDPVDAKQAFSDVIRQSVNDTWDQSLSSRVNHLEESGVLLIMQRLHEMDLTGHLLDKVKSHWTVLSIPMRYDGYQTFDAAKDIGRSALNDPRTEIGQLLFPQRFSERAVQSLEEDLGDYGVPGQLQQRPVALGGNILKEHWWRVWPDDKKLPICDHIFYSWDTAYSTKDYENTSYSAYSKWGIFWDEQEQRHNILLLGRWAGRVDYPDLRAKAAEVTKKDKPDAHLIEKKASGQSLIQDMRRIKTAEGKVRIRTYQPDRDKISRAYAIQSMLQSGQVYIPNKEWAQDFIKQVSKFPSGAPPSSDYTDTVTQALLYLRNSLWVHHPDDDIEETPSNVLTDEEREDEKIDVIKFYG